MLNCSGVNYIETEDTCQEFDASVVEPIVSKICENLILTSRTPPRHQTRNIVSSSICSTLLPFNINRTTAYGDGRVTTTACNVDGGAMLCNDDPVMNANLWIDGNIL
ncbi:hypothetical protein CDAR_526331 [Caerostris darwini]|uniref:Uncharacterized protein n=1 Tax=Caerostris darwini TaxID=1538125 RepID=A0AAV4R3M1_9ARAC|nr:hypothetical protein CDAR_526331 [Caerostris darwini]